MNVKKKISSLPTEFDAVFDPFVETKSEEKKFKRKSGARVAFDFRDLIFATIILLVDVVPSGKCAISQDLLK